MFSRGAWRCSVARSLDAVSWMVVRVIRALSTPPLQITRQSSAVGAAIVMGTLRMMTWTARQSTVASIVAHSAVTLLAVIVSLSLANLVSPRTIWRLIGQKLYACASPQCAAASGAS